MSQYFHSYTTISYQPGTRDQLKEGLMAILQRGGSMSVAKQWAYSRRYTRGFVDQVWDDIVAEELVQRTWDKPGKRQWVLTQKGRDWYPEDKPEMSPKERLKRRIKEVKEELAELELRYDNMK